MKRNKYRFPQGFSYCGWAPCRQASLSEVQLLRVGTLKGVEGVQLLRVGTPTHDRTGVQA